jgi:hypothetical protein
LSCKHSKKPGHIWPEPWKIRLRTHRLANWTQFNNRVVWQVLWTYFFPKNFWSLNFFLI